MIMNLQFHRYLLLALLTLASLAPITAAHATAPLVDEFANIDLQPPPRL